MVRLSDAGLDFPVVLDAARPTATCVLAAVASRLSVLGVTFVGGVSVTSDALSVSEYSGVGPLFVHLSVKGDVAKEVIGSFGAALVASREARITALEATLTTAGFKHHSPLSDMSCLYPESVVSAVRSSSTPYEQLQRFVRGPQQHDDNYDAWVEAAIGTIVATRRARSDNYAHSERSRKCNRDISAMVKALLQRDAVGGADCLTAWQSFDNTWAKTHAFEQSAKFKAFEKDVHKAAAIKTTPASGAASNDESQEEAFDESPACEAGAAEVWQLFNAARGLSLSVLMAPQNQQRRGLWEQGEMFMEDEEE